MALVRSDVDARATASMQPVDLHIMPCCAEPAGAAPPDERFLTVSASG